MSDQNNDELEENEQQGSMKSTTSFEKELVEDSMLDPEGELLTQTEPENDSGEQESTEEAFDTIPEAEESNLTMDKEGETPLGEVTETVIPKKKGNGILWGVLALIVVAGFMWKSGVLSLSHGKVDMPVAYAKENALYMDDLKNKPYQVTKKLSDGGAYSYYYSAWGVECTKDAKTFYYSANVKPDGTFQLYHRGVSGASENNSLIAEDVVDYQMSADGTICAYLKEDAQQKVSLYTHGEGGEVLISTDIPLVQDAYFLSQDGKFVAYQKMTDKDNVKSVNLYASPVQKKEEVLVGVSLQRIVFAKELNKLFYVTSKENAYNIYEYGFGGTPVLIADKATAMELLPNEKDLLYCTQSDSKIKCTNIVEDDKAKEDAKVEKKAGENKIQDATNNAKEQRDKLRLDLKNKEWDSPMQNCYVWSEGKSIEVASEILNATVVRDKSGYILYSTIDTSSAKKVKLSEVQSEEEARYVYFSGLSVAPRLTYLAKPGTTAAAVEKTNISSESFLVSPAQDRIAFQEVDMQTGSTKLFTAGLGKGGTLSDYKEVAAQAQNPLFGGKGNTLYYLTQFNSGVGTLNSFSNGEAKAISENVSGYRVADDLDIAYFISDADGQTGNGNLKLYENGAVKDIDSDVFCMQYKENGKLVYLKNYDIASEKGDLYYWNGKESRKVDEGVSSIFIY